MLCGVATGMANYLNVDPTIIRLAWVIAVLLPGPNLIILVAYLILCLVIPEEAPPPPVGHSANQQTPTGPPPVSPPPAQGGEAPSAGEPGAQRIG